LNIDVTKPKTKVKGKSKPQQRAKRSQKNRLDFDKNDLEKLTLVAIAYSYIEREWFPTEEAYIAEKEVENRAHEVHEEIRRLGVSAKLYPADQYFITNILVDKPDLVVNLVDTLRGRDALQTSVPAALELAEVPYTGAGMQGMVIGNDRNLFKQMLVSGDIPTPPFQYIRRRGTKIDPNIGLPLIVKLNEGGGSVGIDNTAVKENIEEAEQKVNDLIQEYHLPVIVEKFIDSPEITVVAFDNGQKIHIFIGEKVFRKKPDGKHNFTSIESYNDPNSYKYRKVENRLAEVIEPIARKAFSLLHNRDYAKFDVRVDKETGTPYFTDCNPNTAFGPSLGLPFTEVLSLNGIKFSDVLANLLSKHAKKIEKN